MEEEKMQSFFGDGYADYQKASADAKTESLKKRTDAEKEEIKTLIKQLFCKHGRKFKIWEGYVMDELMNARVGVCIGCSKTIVEWQDVDN